MMEKAAASAADEVFLDLEDACAPLEKPAARAKVVEALRTHDWHGKTRVVRINQVTSQFAFDDLREVVTGAGDALDCIMVPKVRNAGDVAFVDRALLQLEQALGLDVGRIGIEAQIEDAEGLMRADEIAFSSDRLETLTYGPADFSASMQLPSLSVRNDYNYPGDIFHYVLFKLAVAARAAGIQVVDGPYLAIHDIDGYRAAASRAAALGYDGKWVLHPVQIEPANETFTPAQADFDKAAQMLEAYRRATEIDRKGAVMLGDEMIDEASRKIAAQFYARGVAAGLRPSSDDGGESAER
jgi:citrate lyase subunit beta / citryl-CoA lyase